MSQDLKPKRYFLGEALDESVEHSEQGYVLYADYAQLERTNAALLGALKEIDRSWTSDGWTPENAKARTVFTDDTIERWKRMRAAIAEAETHHD